MNDPDRDLFGQPIYGPLPTANGEKHRKPTVPRGYAAPPGTGPAGQTCKSCAHYNGHRRTKRYLKCGLMRAVWTNGPGTDIRARAPACRYWEKPKEVQA